MCIEAVRASTLDYFACYNVFEWREHALCTVKKSTLERMKRAIKDREKNVEEWARQVIGGLLKPEVIGGMVRYVLRRIRERG